MVEVSYPGVYAVEVPPVTRAVTGASTSTAAFIGMAERGPTGQAILVTSLTEFFDRFGGFTSKEKLGIQGSLDDTVYLSYAVWSFFQNGGSQCYIVRIATDADAANTLVTKSGKFSLEKTSKPLDKTTVTPEVKFAATQAPFGEAESPLSGDSMFKVWAKSRGTWGNNLEIVIGKSSEQILVQKDGKFIKEDTFRLDVKQNGQFVESYDGISMRNNHQSFVKTNINESSSLINITLVSKDVSLPPEGKYRLAGGTAGKDLTSREIVRQLTEGTSVLDKISDISLIAAPGFADETGEVTNAGFRYAESHRNKLGDAFFIADVPKQVDTRDEGLKFIKSLNTGINGYGAVYFPWIKARDQTAVGKNPIVLLPPSGYIAGVYGRIDATRGVWKSPAGTEATIVGALGLATNLTDKDQGVVNKAGLNVIRGFPGKGTLVWGARTPSPDAAWKYLSVRRMANFLKSSIYDGIQWAVFEPNDTPLWSALKLNIEGFMRNLFAGGAFQGASPDEAFFVKCDAETTTATDQDNGLVNILVGFAPLRPAEFIVIKLSQKLAQAENEAEAPPEE